MCVNLRILMIYFLGFLLRQVLNLSIASFQQFSLTSHPICDLSILRIMFYILGEGMYTCSSHLTKSLRQTRALMEGILIRYATIMYLYD
jgi:hypothetical protein